MVISSDVPDNLFPGILEALLVQHDACQGLLHCFEQEKVGRCQIQQIGQVLQHSDPFHPPLHTGSHMDQRIVPVELPLLLGHGRPLIVKVLQELAKGLDGVGGIDGGSPAGDIVHVDEATRDKKHHDHLFGPADVHLHL